MKIFSFLLLSCFILHCDLFAQAPEILWQNTLGGSGYEVTTWIEPTNDGGYILGGTSESDNSIDKSENNLGPTTYPDDYWVVKLDSAGNIHWENTLGGDRLDTFEGVDQAPDGSYTVIGQSTSDESPDKSEDHCGGTDMWVVNLDETGAINWENTIAGYNYDYVRAFCKTTDGYVLGGNSASNISCDKTDDHYGYDNPHDFWVVKIDFSGNIIWQITIGGEDTEGMRSIKPTQDGGFILVGYTYSSATFDITEVNNGYTDIWVVKISALGVIEWQQLIGGSGYEFGTTVCETPQGEFIVGAYSSSNISGDKTENAKGNYDIWLIKLDADGNTIWDKTIGTTTQDIVYGIIRIFDGNYVLTGYTSIAEADLDKTVVGYGSNDVWIIKFDTNGNIIWQKVLGGSGQEFGYCIQEDADYGLILANGSNSPISGVKTENGIGDYDFWVVKLGPECEVFTSYADADGDEFGNLFSDTIACGIPSGYVLNTDDCDDTNGFVFPGTTDLCNDIDDNCNGVVDEDATELIWYADADGDTYGNAFDNIVDCAAPDGYVADNTDCDDGNPDISPIAEELCNFFDDNCNGVEDEGVSMFVLYEDADGDGFGNPDLIFYSCDEVVTGYSLDNTDCNDDLSSINPDAIEICNGFDENCNAIADETLDFFTLYNDADGDNFGNPEMDTLTCMTIDGFIEDNTDCDDNNPNVYPGAIEVFNGIDDNCNLSIDEGVDINGLTAELVQIYPNPASDELFLLLNEHATEITSINLVNNEGQIVWQTLQPTKKITISVSNFTPGLYLMYFSNANTLFTETIIIQ